MKEFKTASPDSSEHFQVLFFFFLLHFTPHLMDILSFTTLVSCISDFWLNLIRRINDVLSVQKLLDSIPVLSTTDKHAGRASMTLQSSPLLPSPNCITEHKWPHPGDCRSRNSSNLSLPPALST